VPCAAEGQQLPGRTELPQRRHLRRDASVSVGDLVFTPVVLEESTAGATRRGGCWLAAAKRPVAVIVTGPGGRRLARLDTVAQIE